MKRSFERAIVAIVVTAMLLGLAACASKVVNEEPVSEEVTEMAQLSLDAEAVTNLLAAFGIESETYVKTVVDNVVWVQSSETETESDFIKFDKDGNHFHASIPAGISMGEIHSAKSLKSNEFIKYTLKGCTSEMTAEGNMLYDFTYEGVTLAVDFATVELPVTE